MTRQAPSSYVLVSTAFILAWAAALPVSPSCMTRVSLGEGLLPGLGAALGIALAYCFLLVQAYLVAKRGLGFRMGKATGAFALVLMLAGIVGCLAAVACPTLEYLWPSESGGDIWLAALGSTWSLASISGIALGALGVILFWASGHPSQGPIKASSSKCSPVHSDSAPR